MLYYSTLIIELIPYNENIPRKAPTNCGFSMAININIYVVLARNSQLWRGAFTPCSWCSLHTEKNSIYNLPRYNINLEFRKRDL